MTPADKPLLAASAAIALFAWLAEAVVHGRTRQFDDGVRMLVHGHANPALTAAMREISRFGAPAVLIAVGAVIVIWLACAGRRRTAWLFAVTVAGAEIFEELLKLVFRRPRPPAFFGLAESTGYSFPSGHAVVSLTFFSALALFVMPRRWLYYIAAALPVAAIGYSRIYLGVHYPSDVLAGWAAAAVWLFSVASIVAWARR